MEGITTRIFLKSGFLLPGGKLGFETQVQPGYYTAEICGEYAYLAGYAGVGVLISNVEFEFICPIESRVKLVLNGAYLQEIPHCMTLQKENHNCPFIQAGCIGCDFEKEQILSKNAH